jgi:uncharacterized protein YlxW (UPF0749 family)
MVRPPPLLPLSPLSFPYQFSLEPQRSGVAWALVLDIDSLKLEMTMTLQSNQPAQPTSISAQQIQILVERSREQQKVTKLKAVIEAKLKAN